MPKIAIIGGGIAGCTSALELAVQGCEVTIFEQGSDILQGTSANTPGRMGLGYHYFDSNTAKKYMKQTVEFMKHYSDCFIGDKSTSYLMDGRYFVVKDSLINHQELMAGYDEVSGEFEKMCREDKDNDIFGTTHLHRALHEKEFKDDVSFDKIIFAIETKERLLDWQKFSKKLQDEIAKNSNIKIVKLALVKKVSHEKAGKFTVSTSKNLVEGYDYVVNCAWQNIEFLNEQIGIGDSHSKKEDAKKAITSRLKLLAEVELPESLKEKHSMFFCVGPHAMFSNLGNGIGRITYAPVTNHEQTTESKMPEKFEKWLKTGLDEKESKEYGQKIIEGVSKYIPAMKDAKLKKIIPGIVKSKGTVELKNKDSPFHKRDYSGVEEQQIGWIDNASMKLFYCLGNAKEVMKIVKNQESSKSVIKDIIDFASTDEESKELKIIGQFLTHHLQRNFKAEDLTEEKADNIKKDLKKQIEAKAIVLKEIIKFTPDKKDKEKQK